MIKKKQLEVVYRDPESLRPFPRNARTHSEGQIAQIQASILEYGFTNPILLKDDGVTIGAGHARQLAAKAINLKAVPTIIVPGLSDTQWRAYVIADNKMALNAGWDDDMLRSELGGLLDLGFDLELTGFSESELAGLLSGGGGLTDPDEAPDVPEVPTSLPGDVWLLGKHRLVCGDATDQLVVEKALNGVKPHLMVTDPPYGVEYDADWRNRANRSVNSRMDRGKPIGGRAIGKVLNDDRAGWQDAWALFKGDVAYVWHGALMVGESSESLIAEGFVLRTQIIWAKNNFAISRGHYHFQHECCWYAVRAGARGHWYGGHNQTTVWHIDKPQKSETGHSTQKPVECMKRPIENNSSPGQAVYDPFSGSCTTIIAAEMTGRVCHAIELNPGYVDVGLLRWQEFTGREATLEGPGSTYAKIKKERNHGQVDQADKTA